MADSLARSGSELTDERYKAIAHHLTAAMSSAALRVEACQKLAAENPKNLE
jgi:hypothetical protein